MISSLKRLGKNLKSFLEVEETRPARFSLSASSFLILADHPLNSTLKLKNSYLSGFKVLPSNRKFPKLSGIKI
jgi:hypothetical protein